MAQPGQPGGIEDVAELREALSNESVQRESLRHELDAERAARQALETTTHLALLSEQNARELLANRLDDLHALLLDVQSALKDSRRDSQKSLAPRLARLEASLRRLENSSPSLPYGQPPESAGRDSADPSLDARLYLAIEDAFRGSPEAIFDRQEPYAERLLDALGVGAKVLDIGCGRGEFLAALKAKGLSPVGVDTNSAAIDDVQAQGLEGICADAFDYLHGQPDESLDAAVMFHIVEHMPVSATASLLDLLHKKTRPGGILIIETPNAENLRVGAHTFWLDPTHVRPVPPLLLELLVRFYGFDVLESLRLSPYADLPEDADDVAKALLGPQDFGIVAQRC